MKLLLFLLLLCSMYAVQAQQQLVQKQLIKKRFKTKEYYEDGVLKAKGKMARGLRLSGLTSTKQWRCAVTTLQRDGKWIEYYPNGRKKRVLRYRNGEEQVIRTW